MLLVLSKEGKKAEIVSNCPIIIIPSTVGNFSFELQLSMSLRTTYPERYIFSIEREKFLAYKTLEVLADDFVKKILETSPQATHFAICGEGILLFAVAKELLKQKKTISFMGVINSNLTQHLSFQENDEKSGGFLVDTYREIGKLWKLKEEFAFNKLSVDFQKKSFKEKVDEVHEGFEWFCVKQQISGTGYKAHLALIKHNLMLRAQYKLTKQAIPFITVFSEQEVQAVVWKDYSPNPISIVSVIGTQEEFLKEFYKAFSFADFRAVFLVPQKEILDNTITFCLGSLPLLFPDHPKNDEHQESIMEAIKVITKKTEEIFKLFDQQQSPQEQNFLKPNESKWNQQL